MGKTTDTRPNPALLKKSVKFSNIDKTADKEKTIVENGLKVEEEKEEEEEEEFWPAYMLADWSLERAGRWVSICPYICVYLSVSMCLSVRVYVSICPCICVYLSLYMCLSVRLYVSICPRICVCLPVYMHVCLVSVYPFVYMFVSIYVCECVCVSV